jgi:hypothetical protein
LGGSHRPTSRLSRSFASVRHAAAPCANIVCYSSAADPLRCLDSEVRGVSGGHAIDRVLPAAEGVLCDTPLIALPPVVGRASPLAKSKPPYAIGVVEASLDDD